MAGLDPAISPRNNRGRWPGLRPAMTISRRSITLPNKGYPSPFRILIQIHRDERRLAVADDPQSDRVILRCAANGAHSVGRRRHLLAANTHDHVTGLNPGLLRRRTRLHVAHHDTAR